jgi:hypothetical protein
MNHPVKLFWIKNAQTDKDILLQMIWKWQKRGHMRGRRLIRFFQDGKECIISG